MTPSKISDRLANDAAKQIDELIYERHAGVIAEVCCLKELFDIAESAERISFHNYCDGMLVDRIRTLKTKLKERNIQL